MMDGMVSGAEADSEAVDTAASPVWRHGSATEAKTTSAAGTEDAWWRHLADNATDTPRVSRPTHQRTTDQGTLKFEVISWHFIGAENLIEKQV